MPSFLSGIMQKNGETDITLASRPGAFLDFGVRSYLWYGEV